MDSVNTGTDTGADTGTGAESGAGQAIPADFLNALNEKFSEYDKKLSETKTDPTIEKLKAAFSGEQPRDKQGKWIDKHLGRILEARQRGQEMPITEDLVVELQKQMDEMNSLKTALKEAQAALKHMKNPQVWQDNQIFSDMDNTLSSTLERVYGEANPKMHGLISEVIAERLGTARKEQPELWEKIRNDKTLQRKIVMKAVSEVVPPQAMNMMREKHEASQPITPELWSQAWEEASQIEDRDLRAEVKAQLRAKMYEMKAAQRNRR